MADERDRVALTGDIRAARDRLISRIESIPDDLWVTPLSAADPRTVGVVCDHVAHSYEYLAGWLQELLAGQTPEISSDLVDALNRSHAGQPAQSSQAVVSHLGQSSEVLVGLVESMGDEDLVLGDGLARQILVIAARHPDGHRLEIDALTGT